MPAIAKFQHLCNQPGSGRANLKFVVCELTVMSRCGKNRVFDGTTLWFKCQEPFFGIIGMVLSPQPTSINDYCIHGMTIPQSYNRNNDSVAQRAYSATPFLLPQHALFLIN